MPMPLPLPLRLLRLLFACCGVPVVRLLHRSCGITCVCVFLDGSRSALWEGGGGVRMLTVMSIEEATRKDRVWGV
jgi:hypothetical protein